MNKYKRTLLLGIFIIIFIGIIGILVKWDKSVLNRQSSLQNIPTDTYLVCILNYTVLKDRKGGKLDFVEDHANYETKARLYVSKSGLINLKFYDYSIRKFRYEEAKSTHIIKVENNNVFVYEKGKYIQNKNFKTFIKKTADHSYQVVFLNKSNKTYMGMGLTCK